MNESSISAEVDPTSINVERAVPGDAEAISELLRITWLATYPNEEIGITEEDIRLRTEGEQGERIPKNIENWRTRIETNDGSMAVFVVRYQDKILGMTSTTIVEGKRNIGAMYVHPNAQNKGVGSRLMQSALDWHVREDDTCLLVASYNQNAISFYEKFGFVKTQTEVVDTGNVYKNTKIPEIEMVLKANQNH